MNVTESAARHLARVLDSAANGLVIRVAAGTNGWMLQLDSATPRDCSFEVDGRTVLVVDDDTAEALAQARLDLRQTDEGAELVLTEPLDD